MSTGQYEIVNRPAGQVLTAFEYNTQDHNNHIINNTPDGNGAYSDNASQMGLVVSPGGVGTESLAMSLAGELERLRYSVKLMKGYISAGGTAPTFWYTPFTASVITLPHALVTRTTAQSIPNNTVTPLSFSSADFVTNSIWVIGSPTLFTAPATGIYYMGTSIFWTASSIASTRLVQIRENATGKLISTELREIPLLGTAATFSQSIACEWKLTAGDTVQFEVAQSTGGALSIAGTGTAARSTRTFFIQIGTA